MTATGASLERLAWPDLEPPEPRVLVVPLGATEQHGPHLPLTTDTDIAVALAARLAARRDDVVVAPAVAYGASGEHQGFPGTLSIGREALELLLVELGRSASAAFPRLLYLCTHGGNALPVRRAVEQLRREGRDAAAFFPDWRGDAHAGHAETSLMLALAPERVAAPLAAGATAPLAGLLPELVRRGVRAVSANGILGDARDASAGVGEALLERALDELEDVLDAWVRL